MGKDLFAFHGEQVIRENAPLAERLRPRNLDEFVGQNAILAEGRLLRRAIAADRVGNLLLHGPPGVGKTTLARIIASNTRSHFSILNAVLAGVKDLRKEVDAAKDRLSRYGLRTILFVDEVHRFNTAQQDALLPWVENGTLTLIGATTENPYFEVNKALVSRSRLFRLQRLEPESLHQLLSRALEDSESGYGKRNIHLTNEAGNHLVDVANGDARTLLNALELAVESTPPNETGLIHIDLQIAEESIQERAVLYDKQGDVHFDTISAFIKSLRGSDPDASLFWLARMVEAGENPRFIFRRMLIAASEDVGLADPQAIVVVQSCAAAYDRIGLPEGLYLLTEATLYLASTEKSNSLAGFFEAVKTVRDAQKQEVPTHLRDSHRDKEGFGDGDGYRYPHAFTEHWIPQQYLPDALQGEVFWKPTQHGWEGDRRLKILERRSAQLAATREAETQNPLLMTSGPVMKDLDRWVQRKLNNEGGRLQKLLTRLWSDIAWQRHHRVLIIGSSSLFWSIEPLKKVPEGGVAFLVPFNEHSRLLAELEFLDPIMRPILINESGDSLENLDPDFRFEVIGGRLNWDRLNDIKFHRLFSPVTQRSSKNTELRLVFTLPCFGPAHAIKEVIKQQKLVDIDFSKIDNLLSKEIKWLNFQSQEDLFYDYLRQLGWEFTIEEWFEKIELIVDEGLEKRWFSIDSKYRKIFNGNDDQILFDYCADIFKKIKGSKISQSLVHKRIIGRLI